MRTPAPKWTGTAVLPDGTFKALSSDAYLGKWLVLFFYPMDYTFVCPTEIRSYSEAFASELAQINTEVVGVSIDSKFVHLAWTKTPREDGGVGKLEIPLIADVTKGISTAYGSPEHFVRACACTSYAYVCARDTWRAL